MLDVLLQDWVHTGSVINAHFGVFIGNGFKYPTNVNPFRSSIFLHCRPIAYKPQKPKFFSRHISYEPPSQYQIAYINQEDVEFHYSHYIGLKKGLKLYAYDVDLFVKLKDIMYLMHKVHYGKSCPLERSSMDVVANQIQI